MSGNRAAFGAVVRDMKVGYFEAQHDFYGILGLRASATTSEIRRAHRRLVWELHPDRPRGVEADPVRIRLVNLAATVLLNPAARARYDELRRLAASGRLESPAASAYGWRPPRRSVRAAAYRTRRRGVYPRAPVTAVADEFFRRLVGASLLVTALVVCVTEVARPAHRARDRAASARNAITYAPDYPPYPVRYAAIAIDDR